MPTICTSTQHPSPALRLRHSVGWFRFTFLFLTLCMYFAYADIYPTHRARSPAAPARRGAAPSSAICRHDVCARACHPSYLIPWSPSLFISYILSLRETFTRTWTVHSCAFTARTGATQSAAPVVNHTARRAAAVRPSRRAVVRVT